MALWLQEMQLHFSDIIETMFSTPPVRAYRLLSLECLTTVRVLSVSGKEPVRKESTCVPEAETFAAVLPHAVHALCSACPGA